MADHARIDDLDVIREMGKGLGRIHKAFEGLPGIVESYGEDFGHDDLTDKFEDFEANWNLNRDKLQEELKFLSEYALAAAKTYSKLDHELAKVIREAQSPGKKGK
ncbi:hypothetical protein A4E84_23475 [Streptomyces qaidamensis]|uniref:ESX-1 secretion-associated protein n=1 Tax=Streptomyces qaidamensis TaxID=1783515 RepID=A0A143C423_9ACTN|nr:hypothetical protein [Streptomyces qaidamensis]AMW12193.1 hypothetical protein A4E84_23475 [Streptomyces qaidamensis]